MRRRRGDVFDGFFFRVYLFLRFTHSPLASIYCLGRYPFSSSCSRLRLYCFVCAVSEFLDLLLLRQSFHLLICSSTRVTCPALRKHNIMALLGNLELRRSKQFHQRTSCPPTYTHPTLQSQAQTQPTPSIPTLPARHPPHTKTPNSKLQTFTPETKHTRW
jgi:hypothetical protein